MKLGELTHKVALFKHNKYGDVNVASSDLETCKEYVRVSEYLTITFTPRKSDEVIAAAVAAIDAEIVEAKQAVRNLEQRKAELLALPAPEAQ